MNPFFQDLRDGLRVLAKTPGVTAAAVLTLAAGIGANVVIFSAVNALFLRGLEVEDPGALVSLGFSHKKDVGMGLVSSHWTIEKAALVRSFSESMIR